MYINFLHCMYIVRIMCFNSSCFRVVFDNEIFDSTSGFVTVLSKDFRTFKLFSMMRNLIRQ